MNRIALTRDEVQQFRAETRGTALRTHFNNAGTSLPPDIVVDTVISYIKEEAMFGGYETEASYQEQLEYTYTLIARLINAEKDEVAIVENSSQAWGLAFNGIRFNPGEEIITSEMEYETNLFGFINARKAFGVVIKVIENDEAGNFSLAALEAAITPATRLIAVTHIASSSGSMLPVAEIGKIARSHNILYLVDACQTVGQLPIDVKEMGCDMLSVTGRKFLRGPRGTGFLFVRKDVLAQLKVFFMDSLAATWINQDTYELRPDARRFELFEKNRALNLGLGKAIEYALAIGVDRIWERIQLLSALLREQLSAIEGVTVHDKGQHRCGIVTFTCASTDSQVIKSALALKHINVAVSLAGSTLLYMNKQRLANVVRASVHYYNTEEEIKFLCDAVRELKS